MFKICAIVSSYRPEPESLAKNILSYLPDVDHLIIWDNTLSSESCINQLVSELNTGKVEVRTSGRNEYLAKPFNDCFRWAKENGYTHVLTMDQDSSFKAGEFKIYLRSIRNSADDSIAVFGPNVEGEMILPTAELVEVETVITSGAVYPLDKFEINGLFREDFLIYMIDVEYCLRVREKGYKVMCIAGVTLSHQMGHAKKAAFGLTVKNTPAQSTYYRIRNIILTWRLFPQYHAFWSQSSPRAKFLFYKYNVCYRLAKIVFEDKRRLKCKAIFLGMIHGWRSRSGRYDVR